jgi:hypothetical protein
MATWEVGGMVGHLVDAIERFAAGIDATHGRASSLQCAV